MKTTENLSILKEREMFSQEFISALENYSKFEPIFETFLIEYRAHLERIGRQQEREVKRLQLEKKQAEEVESLISKLATEIEKVPNIEKKTPTFGEIFAKFLELLRVRVANDRMEYDNSFEPFYKTVLAWYFGIETKQVPTGKHIWIKGATGSGKTTIIQLCNETARFFGYERYLMRFKTVKNANKVDFDATIVGSVILDDIGAERITDAFNEQKYVIGNRVPDMLMDCYEKRTVSKFAVTSNFSINELLDNGKGYDDRIISRCKGMFVEIEFPNVDFREGV